MTNEKAEYYRNWRNKNAAHVARKRREYSEKIRNEGIKHYGGKCTCCGEDIKEFLTLEHLNGRDKSVKKRTGKRAWAEAKN